MDLTRSLQDIGFTEYEAKVYLALLGNPGITGYEVGRRSGVPGAKVYEVLEGLARKGAALQEACEGRQLYHALDHNILLSKHSQAVSKLIANLGSELDAVTVRRREPRLLMLRDQDSALDHFRQICATVRGHLLVTGWPEDLIGLRAELAAAEERGVTVYVLSYGELDASLDRLVTHSVTTLQHLQIAANGRWLGAVSDMQQCLLVQLTGADAGVGLWTDIPALVSAVAHWIQHDIYLMVYAAAMGPRLQAQLSQEELRLLGGLWDWDPATVPPPDLPPGAPPADRIIANIGQRLAGDPDLANQLAGGYEFRLTGPGGGTYHVDSRGGRPAAGAGELAGADLVVTMSADDLRALATGALPPGAVYVRGRISVSGDLRLAGLLRRLLGI